MGSAMAVTRGAISDDVKIGQLSPGTTVLCTTTVPVPASLETEPQTMLTLTIVVCPETTLNGELVPMQVTPAVVMPDIDMVLSIPVGMSVARLAVALGFVVLIVPIS